ncbi:MAG TPA: antitoxin [Actinomycetota bacterium]|nr:antitoxin [Actinomycetota bacterium]
MLQKRLHILIDDDRYRRVAAEAQARGVSVGRVIRDAIDVLLPADRGRRARAARRILAAHPMPVPDPSELQRELSELRGRRA